MIQSPLQVHPIPTRVFRQGENLLEFICEQTPPALVRERMVLAVTSKVVSVAECRMLQKSSIEKENLIAQEADHNLGEVAYGCYLTIKHGLFIPSAGIDESNSEKGEYILYPEDPFGSAEALWWGLRERWNLRELGILLTDSHTTPLRRGVTGIALAHWGFRGLKNLVGAPDLFGRRLEVTTVNIADALASAATLLMGEANESRPLAAIFAQDLVFREGGDEKELKIPVEHDLYYPFFREHLGEKLN